MGANVRAGVVVAKTIAHGDSAMLRHLGRVEVGGAFLNLAIDRSLVRISELNLLRTQD
jgi:hypothetical protein